jgi:ferritin-like metal-binding protein YciE
MKALKNLFLNELADMNDSEHRIIKALPKMIQAATCGKLQQVLEHHLQETEEQIAQIEKVFAAFAEKPKTKKCPAIAGILEEGDRIVTENKKTTAINAAIIAACQKVEHHEIASYGALRAWAQLLGNQEAADLLDEILDQEKDADQALNDLAIAKNRETLEEVEVGTGVSA